MPVRERAQVRDILQEDVQTFVGIGAGLQHLLSQREGKDTGPGS